MRGSLYRIRSSERAELEIDWFGRLSCNFGVFESMLRSPQPTETKSNAQYLLSSRRAGIKRPLESAAARVPDLECLVIQLELSEKATA